MISIPLPFVIAFMLLILLARMIAAPWGEQRNFWFIALVAVATLQLTLIGFRWGYGFQLLATLQAVGAATLPPLAFVCFDELRTDVPKRSASATAAHLVLPGIAILMAVYVWRDAIDGLLFVIGLVYGGLLARLAAYGPDVLGKAELGGAVPTSRALKFTAASILLSAIGDVAIAADFIFVQGQHVASIVGTANILGLISMGVAATWVARAQTRSKRTAAPPILVHLTSVDLGSGLID